MRISWPLREPRDTIFIDVKAKNLSILNSILSGQGEENEKNV